MSPKSLTTTRLTPFPSLVCHPSRLLTCEEFIHFRPRLFAVLSYQIFFIIFVYLSIRDTTASRARFPSCVQFTPFLVTIHAGYYCCCLGPAGSSWYILTFTDPTHEAAALHVCSIAETMELSLHLINWCDLQQYFYRQGQKDVYSL